MRMSGWSEDTTGIEPVTTGSAIPCSTTELRTQYFFFSGLFSFYILYIHPREHKTPHKKFVFFKMSYLCQYLSVIIQPNIIRELKLWTFRKRYSFYHISRLLHSKAQFVKIELFFHSTITMVSSSFWMLAIWFLNRS